MKSRILKLARIVTLLGLLALVPLFAACSRFSTEQPGAPSGGQPSEEASAPSSIDATVRLLDPVEGAQVSAGTIVVRVETSGITFTMPSNTNVAGEGHVHFTLDDRPFVMSTELQAEIRDVEPGPHTLKAELVQNNTTSFDPPIQQIIEFTAQ